MHAVLLNPSGSPRFQGRLREPAASSTDACQSSSERLGSSQMSRSPSPNRFHASVSAPEPMMSSDIESGQDIFHRNHPNFLNSGFTCAIAESISSAVGSMPRNAINSLITVSGSSVSLAKLIRWTGNFGMFLYERFAMFQKRTLDLVAASSLAANHWPGCRLLRS